MSVRTSDPKYLRAVAADYKDSGQEETAKDYYDAAFTIDTLSSTIKREAVRMDELKAEIAELKSTLLSLQQKQFTEVRFERTADNYGTYWAAFKRDGFGHYVRFGRVTLYAESGDIFKAFVEGRPVFESESLIAAKDYIRNSVK
jgi:hypothetical protein